jgi:hypothetical protein
MSTSPTESRRKLLGHLIRHIDDVFMILLILLALILIGLTRIPA